MANNRLSALQQDFLNAFFSREARFFLTGGGALVGFHLGHRETHDLIPPGSVSTEELRQYLADLIARLTRLAFPQESQG